MRPEWIVRRCTQKWVGSELQYEDWGAATAGVVGLLTRPQMLRALEECRRRWPDDEFAGHCVGGCQCPEHSLLRKLAEAHVMNGPTYSILRNSRTGAESIETVVESGLSWKEATRKRDLLQAAESAANPAKTSWTIDIFQVRLEEAQ